MNELQEKDEYAAKLLDSLLGYLGFNVRIEVQRSEFECVLHLFTKDAEWLIGERGEVLEDLQYLLNRMLVQKSADIGKYKVDVEYYRTMKDDRFIEEIKNQGLKVVNTGVSVVIKPMNSYYRKLVHELFKTDEKVKSVSIEGDEKRKRIRLEKR
jgi:spoIIIJ-associated protein